MTAAIFGLLGVVIGAVLQGALAWWAERRRERRAVRKAARLLAVDLGRCAEVLEYGVKYPDPQRPGKPRPLSFGELLDAMSATLDRWRQVSDVFADVADHSTWMQLVESVGMLDGLMIGEPPREHRIASESGAALRAMAQSARAGERTAWQLAGASPDEITKRSATVVLGDPEPSGLEDREASREARASGPT